MIKVGDKVTAFLVGATRGAVVLKVNKDKSILVNCPCPRGTEFEVKFGKYQESSLWNDPKTRKAI